MAPFSIPTPSIIPLRIPEFRGTKSIDTNTRIEIFCETYLEHEIFYTIDGTKPQPYAGIVQGNKTIKYISPFCLPAGKITIKAIAINAAVHTMCSSIVTKSYEVLKVESADGENVKTKQRKNSRKDSITCENKKKSNENSKKKEESSDVTHERLEWDSVQESVTCPNCLEEAFIGSSDFELESREDCTENNSHFPVSENCLDINDNIELSQTAQLVSEHSSYEDDSLSESMGKMAVKADKSTDKTILTDSGTSIETRFCCLKCDLTLQQCINCNKMNAVSSKFCIECGEQLLQICYFCKNFNPAIATFCQSCGKKIGARMEPYIRLDLLDQGVMAQPELKNAAIQVLTEKSDKCVQTVHDSNSHKRSYSGRMPPVSPGRGYWHQQLDYICNHLKTHAYNNVDFRKEISEPSLCDFKSANIIKEENAITVTLSFTPFVPGKITLPTSEETKSEDRHHENF